MNVGENSIWIPLIASIGVGAATFYSMTSRKQNLGQALLQAAPFFSSRSNHSAANSHSGKLGPFGMS